MKKIIIIALIIIIVLILLSLEPIKRLECLTNGTKYKVVKSCHGPRCSFSGICVVVYKDGGDKCNSGRDCESGMCEIGNDNSKFCVKEQFNCGEFHEYIDKQDKVQKYQCIF